MCLNAQGGASWPKTRIMDVTLLCYSTAVSIFILVLQKRLVTMLSHGRLLQLLKDTRELKRKRVKLILVRFDLLLNLYYGLKKYQQFFKMPRIVKRQLGKLPVNANMTHVVDIETRRIRGRYSIMTCTAVYTVLSRRISIVDYLI